MKEGLAYLIYDVLQQDLLVINRQSSRRDDLGLEHQEHDWILRRAGAVHPVAAGVELRPHGLGVLAQLRQMLGLRLQHHERLAGRHGRDGRQGSGESVGSGAETLVFDDHVCARAEAAGGCQRSRHGADEHVDFGGVDVLVFRYAPSRAAQYAKGPCLVQDQPEFVLEFQFDLECTRTVSEKFPRVPEVQFLVW